MQLHQTINDAMTEGLQGSGATAHAQYAAAAAALSKGALREADRLAEQLWQAFPDDPDVWHLVAGLRARQGDHVVALKAVQHAGGTNGYVPPTS